jgi:CheY-like chemotaxis protein
MKFDGKVLLADDEAHIRKFVRLVLQRLGSPTILEAKNGREAITLFTQEEPDLVLLDINMPLVDGLEALAAIRQANPEAVVVMLTSLVNRQTVDECHRLGAMSYLRKDVTRDELTTQLTHVLTEAFGDEPEPPAESTPSS